MNDNLRPVELRLRKPLGEQLLQLAAAEALQLYHDYLGVEHLLMALSRCEGGHTQRMLDRMRLEPKLLRAKLRAQAGKNAPDTFSGRLAPTPRLRRALAQAQERAGDAEMGEQALLLALLESGLGLAVRVLTEEGADIQELIAAVRADAGPEATEALHGSSDQRERPRHLPDNEPVPPATGHRTPFLDRYGQDLTSLAAAGKMRPVTQRKEYFAEIARALARQDRNAPVLVGEAGVGKTAIVQGLAQRLADTGSQVVALLQGKRIVQIEVAALVAGAAVRGDFEERMRALLRECADHPEVIMFIDEIHTLVGAGHSSGNQDAAQLIKPALERGELRLIGATTSAEYQRYIAKDAALDRRFQAIPVAEPSPDAAEALLREMLPNIEARTNTRINPEAVVSAIELSVRYIHDQRLPGKAVSVLYDACARAIVPGTGISIRDDLGLNGAGGAALVTSALVEDAVSHHVGFPISQTDARMRERLLDLEDKLGQRVVAQDEALAVVANAVRVGYASVRDPSRPKAVMLFTGPSGVGKTETARALAETLFGEAAPQQLLTLDMAMFGEKHLLAQLIGSPPGYVDSDQEGRLTSWLRLHPFGIVLFDEIEKAHAEVRQKLLGLFEEGWLVDAHGRVIWGREAIYIMTANLLADAAAGDDSTDEDEQLPVEHPSHDGATQTAARALEQITRSRLASMLSPEFVGRIDRVVVYKPLTHEAMREIIQQKLDRIRDRLRPQQVELWVAPEVFDWLAQHGVSATTGARHLDTLIQREIAEPIATLEFSGRLTPGAQLRATLDGAHPQVAIILER